MPPPNSLFDLTGRTALVTGSSRGLGMAMARGLCQAGAMLVPNGRDEAKPATSAAALRAEGHNVATVTFDVTTSSAIESAVAQMEAEITPIGIPVPDAGLARRGNPNEAQR
jgi:gluconate 5-dehydrogenase